MVYVQPLDGWHQGLGTAGDYYYARLSPATIVTTSTLVVILDVDINTSVNDEHWHEFHCFFPTGWLAPRALLVAVLHTCHRQLLSLHQQSLSLLMFIVIIDIAIITSVSDKHYYFTSTIFNRLRNILSISGEYYFERHVC